MPQHMGIDGVDFRNLDVKGLGSWGDHEFYAAQGKGPS